MFCKHSHLPCAGAQSLGLEPSTQKLSQYQLFYEDKQILIQKYSDKLRHKNPYDFTLNDDISQCCFAVKETYISPIHFPH